MEIDIEERLKVARNNLATLQSRRDIASQERDTISQEEARLNVLILKYTGTIEYLESLKSETLEPPKVEGDGHGKSKKIPEETATK